MITRANEKRIPELPKVTRISKRVIPEVLGLGFFLALSTALLLAFICGCKPKHFNKQFIYSHLLQLHVLSLVFFNKMDNDVKAKFNFFGKHRNHQPLKSRS